MKRKLVIRGSIILFLIILGIFLFVFGKEHKVFVDNLDLSIAGQTYKADAAYEAWVNGEKVGRTAINPGKRNVAYVAGPEHEIVLQKIVDNEPVGEKIEKSFKLGVSQYEVIINIPALLADSDSFLYQDE